MADPTDHDNPDALAAAMADLTPEESRLFERFAAILALVGPPTPAVVRVERLEVVDRKGRLRVLIGDLGGDGPDTTGIGVYDRRRNERATLALGVGGPFLGFSQLGDDALVLGVDDADTEAVRPGPYLQLLGSDGGVACGWRVDQESGTVESAG